MFLNQHRLKSSWLNIFPLKMPNLTSFGHASRMHSFESQTKVSEFNIILQGLMVTCYKSTLLLLLHNNVKIKIII